MPAVREPLIAEPPAVLGRIPEAAIQDAWVRGLFDPSALRTTVGDAVRVIERGTLNRDSGPDVTGARIQIDGITWAGDVEIHVTSAAWDTHGHHTDPAYDRVVLHVVLSADVRTGTLHRADGSALPELVLLPHLDQSLRSLLRSFYLAPRSAPHCASRWDEVALDLRRDWVRWLGSERMRDRARVLGQRYGRRPDLDRLLILRAMRALGYEANADAFETLADRLDLSAIRQMNAAAIQARLVADSGLAPDTLFERADSAQRPMRREAWKRGGRPANAPLRRIAQAAAWLAGPLRHDAVATLADAVGDGHKAALECLRPDTPDGTPRLGATRAARVLTDAVLPVLLLASEQREDPGLAVDVLDAYQALPAPTDRIVRQFADAGLSPASAAEAQGVHHLARTYCDEGRCARCVVGQELYPALADAGRAETA